MKSFVITDCKKETTKTFDLVTQNDLTSNLFLWVASDKNQVFLSAGDDVLQAKPAWMSLQNVRLSLQEVFFPSGLLSYSSF